MAKEQFEAAMRDAILSLPQDLKAMLRVVEDPDLEDEHRILAAGAVLHLLSGQNAIPGMRGLLAYVDDVIVLRLVLERLEVAAPEVIGQHREDSPELFGPLDEQMEATRGYLGELMAVLDKACDQLPKLKHEGYSAVDCGKDDDAGTWLYDAVHEALVDTLDFDEDEVIRELRAIDTIRRPLELRMAT
ncbi:MAG: hypothetical protein AB8I08_04655 [Sandaracinaceae bacterium]